MKIYNLSPYEQAFALLGGNHKSQVPKPQGGQLTTNRATGWSQWRQHVSAFTN